MNFTSVFVIVSFALFDILYLIRTLFVHSLGIPAWMLGKPTNNTLEKIIEFAAMPLTLVYDCFLFLHAANLNIHPFFTNYVISVPWLRYAGFGCCILGLFLLIFTLSAMFTAKDRLARKYTLDGLIINGIYRYTRNPVFIAMALYTAGIALIYPTIPGIMVVVIACIGIHVHILAEEKYLRAKCGSRYIAYMKRTKRYLLI